jgi:phosphatidylinositol glycan class U
LATLLGCSLVLIALSDEVLQQHPRSQCLRAAVAALRADPGASSLQEAVGSCWAGRVYGLTLFLRDLTPNIGLWWYFFTEVFTEFQPFFLFVFHSFALVLMVPMAVRFRSRPLFVCWVQLFVSCMFRPYACVGDMVPWMVLLPLLQQQLASLKLRMFLVNSFMLLLVLGPAMWHQWIVVDSANANFFYSITLLLGVWYTVFLMQMLRLTVLLDRWLVGKGPPPRLLTADGREVTTDGAAKYAAALQAQVGLLQ